MALTNEDLQAIASLLQPIYDRFDKTDSRLDKIESRLEKVESRLDKVESRLEVVESRLDKVESRLEKVESRLDKVESEVSALKAGQKDLAKEIRKVKDKVNSTYDLALETWGQSTENRKWLESKVEIPS